MSKYLFIVSLLITLHANPQNGKNNNVNKIARLERQAHSKNISQSITLASTNFTVHYYKCEWQIDPSKNYITGKVTPHFIITATTDSLDLIYPMR